jgi:predicted metal-dependent peptidase
MEEAQEEQESQYPDEFAKVFNSFDDHSTWKRFDDIPEATKQLMQNNINTILKNTAEQVEKMRGTIPGEFSELIEKLRQKKPEVFNWKAYFRRLLGSIYDVNIRSTRRKESKRFFGAAGIQHKKKVSILVAIDTSGSVSQKELQEFFSEIDYAYKAGARITILQCDTRINGIEDYDGKNIPEIKGRGGTDFNPPVDYYVKHKKEYASLIYFTDGEAPLPTKHPQGMVWVISSMGYHQDYPGKSIYIPKDNSNNS